MTDKDLDRVVQGTLFGEATLNASVASLLADEGGQYIAANDAAVRLTGYDRQRLTEFRMGELAADEKSRTIYRNLARDKNIRGRKAVRRSDGEIVPCRYWAISTFVSSVPYYFLLLWPQ
jgi:PAS domain S-box-containing protein